jgi:ergothioneine biosynthesis protein EgtB
LKKSYALRVVARESRVDQRQSVRGIEPDALRDVFHRVRLATEFLCEPLEVEDYVVQTMPEVSPTKWHLAHTSWFFETFVLRPGLPGYEAFDRRYAYVFNSYYHAAGDRHPQPQRGLLSRPTVRQVLDYRRHVDRSMERFFDQASSRQIGQFAFAIELGINHEEQHQELILTDAKHVLAANPLEPVYRSLDHHRASTPTPLGWVGFEGGLIEVGQAGNGFAFDNEKPRHPVYLRPFELADRLVTCGEFLSFIQEGGYERPDLWLSEDAVQRYGWKAPLYWKQVGSDWQLFSLRGGVKIDDHEAVCHLSHYEADAFARWAGARLPLEEEWELASAEVTPEGNLLESGELHPRGASTGANGKLRQLFGDVWEWTASAYLPYPGFVPFTGALGEYNGKFMSNKMVLRGGSCVTPRRHIRASYRNFFAADARWQFSGIRLAR